jgi:hypothetical protein
VRKNFDRSVPFAVEGSSQLEVGGVKSAFVAPETNHAMPAIVSKGGGALASAAQSESLPDARARRLGR